MKPGAREVIEAIHPFMSVIGVGLSPDEKTLYVADRPTARLWAFSPRQSGEIAPRKPIYRGAAIGRLVGIALLPKARFAGAQAATCRVGYS
jgi:sugar lactone lactonase YvrE